MNTANSLSQQITQTNEGMKVWQQERLILDVTERICELMDVQGVSRSQLADALDRSRPYITQMLRGSANLTLRTLSDVFLALGRQVQIYDGPIPVRNDRCPPVVLQFDEPENDLDDDEEFDFVLTMYGDKEVQHTPRTPSAAF